MKTISTLLLVSLAIICDCAPSIENDYADWRKSEKEYKKTHRIRGNIWPELDFALKSETHKKLLSYGTESQEFITIKFLEHREQRTEV